MEQSCKRVKFDLNGARKLESWLEKRSIPVVRLSEEMACEHKMALPRALRREGYVLLWQVGRAVAFTGGDVSASDLVGPKLAKAVPLFPSCGPRASKPAEGRAEADGRPELDPDRRSEAERMMVQSYPDAIRVFAEAVKGEPVSPAALRAAAFVAEAVAGKARQKEAERTVDDHAPDDALLLKLQLIYAQYTGRALASIQAEDRGEYEGKGLA